MAIHCCRLMPVVWIQKNSSKSSASKKRTGATKSKKQKAKTYLELAIHSNPSRSKRLQMDPSQSKRRHKNTKAVARRISHEQRNDSLRAVILRIISNGH